MAIIDKKGRLHGKLGRLSYRVLPGNIEVVQTLPRRMRQTRATKESALEFGLASNSAGIIRQAFSNFTCMSDTGMINRLNGAVLRAIKGSNTKARGERDLHDGDLNQMAGFQFNTNSALTQVLPVRPTCLMDAENRIQVALPAFKWSELQKAAYTNDTTIRLMLTVVNFTQGYYSCLDYADFKVEYPDANSFTWSPETIIPAGCIAFVTLSVHCHSYNRNTKEQSLMNSVAYNPVEIIGAYTVQAEEGVLGLQESESTRPITGYLGSGILKDIERLRKKDKTYNQDVLNFVTTKPVNTAPILKEKVFFKKE